MIRIAQFRTFLTWLFFAGSIVSVLVSANSVVSAIELYGADYPESLAKAVPEFTVQFLDVYKLLPTVAATLVGAAIVAVFAMSRFSTSREAYTHSVALLAAFLYHLALMLWLTLVIAFFVLPRAKAGI